MWVLGVGDSIESVIAGSAQMVVLAVECLWLLSVLGEDGESNSVIADCVDGIGVMVSQVVSAVLSGSTHIIGSVHVLVVVGIQALSVCLGTKSVSVLLS